MTSPKAAASWGAPTRALGPGFATSFVEKLEDIVGLYLSPPEHALVLCCDEKSHEHPACN